MNQAFLEHAVALRGKKGEEWVKNIPLQILEYEKKWDIKVGEPFPLYYNYVAPAKRADGTDVVLKIGFPKDKEFLSEVEALKIFNGEGVERILEVDSVNNIILLERVIPGQTLDELHDDEQEARIACGILKKLWQPAPNNPILINLPTWLNGFKRHRGKYKGTSGPFPDELFSECERFFKSEYLKPAQKPMLLHGDFHHKNILSSKRDNWLAIDPKGVIGNSLYDIGTFLNNPRPKLMQRPNIKTIVQKRIDIFSEELSFDKKDIINWGMTQSILCSIWSMEDYGKDWEYGIQFAELLQNL